MNSLVKKIVLGAAAAASIGGATLATTQADAYPYHGGGGWHGGGYGYRGGGWGPGAAIGAGVLGVAIGASLAHPYYGPAPGYYAGPGYWGYTDGCRSYYRWDPYWGRYVRVERCY